MVAEAIKKPLKDGSPCMGTFPAWGKNQPLKVRNCRCPYSDAHSVGQEQILCKPPSFRGVIGIAPCIHTRLHQHGWPPHCPRLACQDGRVLLGFPVLGESALRSRVQRWPCVLALGHRLSLVAVVRSADQRLAIAIIQEQTVAKKDPRHHRPGESCWLASKARLREIRGYSPSQGRFTKESEGQAFPR